MNSFALTWGVFYLDDGLMVGPIDRIKAAFQHIVPALKTIGLSVNPAKCALWGPGTTIEEDSDIPITHYDEGSGLKVLGIP